jgi:hypothetical protein
MQRLQCLCGGFSAHMGASVLTWGLQYLCRGLSTYAGASVLMPGLQYLRIGFSTYTLMLTHNTYPLMPTHLCLLTYAYSLMPTHNAPTMLMPTCTTGASCGSCRRHEKDLVVLTKRQIHYKSSYRYYSIMAVNSISPSYALGSFPIS